MLVKLILLGVVIFQFGCSKGVETSEASKSVTKEKLGSESLVGDKVVQTNFTNISFDFKGVKLGQTVKEFKQVFKGLADVSDAKSEAYACVDSSAYYNCDKIKGLTIANQVPRYASFDFLEKKLILITIEFNPDYFDTVRNAFIQKYGDPTKADEATLSNKLTGVESKYEHLVWTNENGDKLEITNNKKEGSTFHPIGKVQISTNIFDELNSDSSDDDAKDI